MVDVSPKEPTLREAVARGKVTMKKATLKMVESGEIAKGNVLSVAKIAGIMAAKKTGEIIPLCHPIEITGIDLDFKSRPGKGEIEIEATVKSRGRTGVEMEAMTAVSVAALTVYDMCKSADREMVISDIRLMMKSGGKSGTFRRQT